MTFAPDDSPCRHSGEGITRTGEPGAVFWPCEVTFTCRRPMRCTIRAITKQQAKQFAQARHPDAISIDVLDRRQCSWL